MATLSASQLKRLAYDAGFRGEALNVAVAIAMGESGGNPTAYNPEAAAGTRPGSGSRGLWQIYGTAHPWANSEQAFDPSFNAKAAFRVFREAGNSFRPWSVYTNQSYKQYLPTVYGAGINLGAPVKKPKPKAPPAERSVQTVMQTKTAGQDAERKTILPESMQGILSPWKGILNPEDSTLPKLSDLFLGSAGLSLIGLGIILFFAVGYLAVKSEAGSIVVKSLKSVSGG